MLNLKLNHTQLNRLSESSTNLGLVFFGVLVVPVLTGVDKVDILSVILGLAAYVISIIISLILLRRNEKKKI